MPILINPSSFHIGRIEQAERLLKIRLRRDERSLTQRRSRLAPDLKARLFAAFDLNILWNKPMGQATVTVTITITDATLTALPGQDGYDDTSTPRHDEPASPIDVGTWRVPVITLESLHDHALDRRRR